MSRETTSGVRQRVLQQMNFYRNFGEYYEFFGGNKGMTPLNPLLNGYLLKILLVQQNFFPPEIKDRGGGHYIVLSYLSFCHSVILIFCNSVLL